MRIRQRTLAYATEFFDFVPLRFTPLTPCPPHSGGGALGGMLQLYSLSNLAWKKRKYFGSYTIFKPRVCSR